MLTGKLSKRFIRVFFLTIYIKYCKIQNKYGDDMCLNYILCLLCNNYHYGYMCFIIVCRIYVNFHKLLLNSQIYIPESI